MARAAVPALAHVVAAAVADIHAGEVTVAVARLWRGFTAESGAAAPRVVERTGSGIAVAGAVRDRGQVVDAEVERNVGRHPRRKLELEKRDPRRGRGGAAD